MDFINMDFMNFLNDEIFNSFKYINIKWELLFYLLLVKNGESKDFIDNYKILIKYFKY